MKEIQTGQITKITHDVENNFFIYHPPKGDQQDEYEKIRQAAKEFAKVILRCAPDGADTTYAIRLVRQAMMWANAAIACGEANNPVD